MTPIDMAQQQLKRVASLCCNIPLTKLWSGALYGARANIFRPSTVADMELSSPQSLLLALLYSLVEGDIMSCLLLADICQQVKKLCSKHYQLWLLEDFSFPQSDIQKAMALLTDLVTAGTLNLPPHVLRIMTSLANNYGINDVQLRTLSEEGRRDLANQLENAVACNNPGDIIALATEGGDINGSTHSGDNLIHLAARRGCCAAIAALGFLKADLEALNSRNATPLMEAVKNNQKSSVKTLLTYGAEVGKRFYRGDTFLHIAAAGSHNRALEVLLEYGMEVNERNHFGETALLQAVRAGNVQGIEILLHEGADVNIIPEGSESLINIALESQNTDMFKAFVKSGVDLKSKDGDTLLHLAACSRNVELFRIIKNQKLKNNIRNLNGLTPLHVASDPVVIRMLIEMGVDVNIKTEKGETALHLASAKGSLELVKALIQKGAAVDLQDDEGTSALMIASANSKECIVTFLLFSGANLKIKDKEGRTSLHYAAEGGCVGSVRALLEAGAEIDIKNNKGLSPAFFAAMNNKPAVLQVFIEHGADLTWLDGNGDSIIHCTASRGHVEVMTMLLDIGVEVDIKGNHQKTALNWAAMKGHTPLVAGADLEAKEDGGYTPLMRASNQRHLDVVQLLIDHGASVNEKDNNGRTALYWANAVGKKNEAVIDYLKSKGGVM